MTIMDEREVIIDYKMGLHLVENGYVIATVQPGPEVKTKQDVDNLKKALSHGWLYYKVSENAESKQRSEKGEEETGKD